VSEISVLNKLGGGRGRFLWEKAVNTCVTWASEYGGGTRETGKIRGTFALGQRRIASPADISLQDAMVRRFTTGS